MKDSNEWREFNGCQLAQNRCRQLRDPQTGRTFQFEPYALWLILEMEPSNYSREYGEGDATITMLVPRFLIWLISPDGAFDLVAVGRGDRQAFLKLCGFLKDLAEVPQNEPATPYLSAFRKIV